MTTFQFEKALPMQELKTHSECPMCGHLLEESATQCTACGEQLAEISIPRKKGAREVRFWIWGSVFVDLELIFMVRLDSMGKLGGDPSIVYRILEIIFTPAVFFIYLSPIVIPLAFYRICKAPLPVRSRCFAIIALVPLMLLMFEMFFFLCR